MNTSTNQSSIDPTLIDATVNELINSIINDSGNEDIYDKKILTITQLNQITTERLIEELEMWIPDRDDKISTLIRQMTYRLATLKATLGEKE